MSSPRLRDERGFTLIETLVASIVLTVALVAVAQLMAVSIRLHQTGRDSATAARLAQDKVEEMMKMNFTTNPAIQVAGSLEPVTHQPEPWYGVVLNVGLLGLIAATATGLIMQRRWGLVVSVLAALAFTALAVACPVSGHHPFGAWWFGQMACALGMLGASVAAVAWSSRPDAQMPDAATPGVEPNDHSV